MKVMNQIVSDGTVLRKQLDGLIKLFMRIVYIVEGKGEKRKETEVEKKLDFDRKWRKLRDGDYNHVIVNLTGKLKDRFPGCKGFFIPLSDRYEICIVLCTPSNEEIEVLAVVVENYDPSYENAFRQLAREGRVP